MSKVPKKHNLTDRKGVWYYRRRVPQGLEKAMGKSVIQFSLKTKDFIEAAKRRNLQDVEWDARFEHAKDHSDEEPLASSSLSRVEAIEIVKNYVQKTDLDFQEREAKRGPISEEIKRDIEIDLGTSEQTLADLSSEEGLLEIGDAGQKLLAQHNIELDFKDPVHDEFFEFVRRALLELYRRATARLNQDFSHSHFDQMFALPSGKSAEQTLKMPISKICDEYVEEYGRHAEKTKIRKKRQNDIRVGINLILEVMGADTPIQSVTRKMCREFVDVLSRMPLNRNKKYKHLSLEKVLTIAAKEELPTMKWATQNSYLGTLKKVLGFSHMEGHLDKNPAEGLVPLASTVSDKYKRSPYTLEHLQRIFTAPIFTGCLDDKSGFNKPGPNILKKSRFWVPLISLFTGMRMNEICQLNLIDVKCTDAGTNYFQISPNTEDQSVKNLPSWRQCPVHPILIRVGFLTYIDDLRGKEETKVFPDIPLAKGTGYRSDVFTKRYATFQKGVGIPSKVGIFPNEQRFTFHSFRHNFRDELRRIEAPIEIVELLGGWSSGGNAVHQDYGKGYTPDHLFKYVKKVGYPGLDLSHLYKKKK